MAAPCLALLAGCTEDSTPPIELEVFTWWQETSETKAFAAIEARLDDDVRVSRTRDQSATLAREDLTQYLLMDLPPSSFQANLGADVLRWSIVDLLESPEKCCTRTNYLEPIDDLVKSSGLLANLDDYVREHLYLHDHYYAVPLNIHRLNLLYFNRTLLPDAERSITIETLCPADPTHGAPEHRIAIGYTDGFSLTQLTFEALLPSLYGPNFYEELFIKGSADLDWHDKMRHALECVRYLSRGFLRQEQMRWPDAVLAVQEGRAAFTITGDWAAGALGTSHPADVGSMVVPHGDNEAAFIYTADTFPLPVGAPHRAEALELLEVMTRADVQIDFSKAKGSMPARSDARRDPAFASSTRDDFEDPSKVKLLATSGLFPPYFPISDINKTLREMTELQTDESVEDALTIIENAHYLIAQWQDEIDDPPGAPASSP